MRPKLVPVLFFFASMGLIGPVARADDPGTVLVLNDKVDEAPVPVKFTVPVGVPYKLSFNDTRLRVWSSPQAFPATQLSANTVYTGGQGVFGDVNGDHKVDLADVTTISNNRGTEFAACDLNGNGMVEEADLVACRNVLGNGGDTLTVYVEGLSVSAALGDVTLQLLTDPDGDSQFTPATSRIFTIAHITISQFDEFWAGLAHPWQGILGTALTVTIEPAIAPLTFDASTTATWCGVIYSSPVRDSRTPEIRTEYSAAHIQQISPSQAAFLIGSGTNVGGQIGDTPLEGVICGPMTFHFSGVDVKYTFYFEVYPVLPTGVPTYFFSAAGGGGVGDPVFDEPLHILDRSDPYWGNITLEQCTASQYIATVLAENNALMQAITPPALPMQIVIWNHEREEMGRTLVWLYPSGRDDGGPNLQIFYSDWRRPIVFVSSYVDPAAHPDLTIIPVDPEGFYYDFRIR